MVQLEKFLERHKINKAHRLFLNEHIGGKFRIYFKRANNRIVNDQIEITFNEMAVRADGEFTHTPTEKGGLVHKWVGPVSVHDKNNVCIMNLSNEKSTKFSLGEEEEPVLITFSLPKATFELSEAQCFQGLITGLEDEQHGVVAYRCLIVREGGSQPDLERLAGIFQNEKPMLVGSNSQQKFMLQDFQFT